jgi:hypothetical protein
MTPEEQIVVIRARAEGKEIECRQYGETWSKSFHDFNFRSLEYRVKPKPNIRCVFDGETQELESVEIIK